MMINKESSEGVVKERKPSTNNSALDSSVQGSKKRKTPSKESDKLYKRYTDTLNVSLRKPSLDESSAKEREDKELSEILEDDLCEASANACASKGEIFKRKQNALERDLKECSSSKFQPDSMKMLAQEMLQYLEKLKIEGLINKGEKLSSFVDTYGMKPSKMLDWKESVERKIRRIKLTAKE